MKIKAGRIGNLTDARYFAAEEVDYLGFNLEEGTEGYLEPLYMRAMREWVQGPVIVGEFGRTPAHIVKEAAAFFDLDAVQVRWQGQQQDWQGWQGASLLLEMDAAELSESLLSDWRPLASGFLVHVPADADAPGLIEKYAHYPIFWAFDRDLENLMHLINNNRLFGLHLVGGEEEKVGIKSFDDLERLFSELREKG